VPEFLCVIDGLGPNMIGDIAVMHKGDIAVSELKAGAQALPELCQP